MTNDLNAALGHHHHLYSAVLRETLIQSLSDFILGFFMQSKKSSDANSELFKEDEDEAMYKNPYEI
uniref:hypothetical protein n=1 Tax=Dialister sp. TaxID=1955814 RepID=UPI0040252B68